MMRSVAVLGESMRSAPYSLLPVLALAGCASLPVPRATAPTPVEFRCAPSRVPSPALAALRPEFRGNARIPREYLECALGNGLGDAPADPSDRELVERAEMLLHGACYDLGFLRARVTASRVGGATRFDLVEGERFRVGAVSVGETDARGASVAPLGGEDALRRSVRLRRGEWFSRAAVAHDLAAIRRRYRDAGYASVEVLSVVDLRPSSGVTDLRVEIRRGPLVTVQRVEVTGDGRASREALLEGFRPGAGELYSETALDASRARIVSAGLAHRVDLSTEAVPDRPDRVVLHLEVRE